MKISKKPFRQVLPPLPNKSAIVCTSRELHFFFCMENIQWMFFLFLHTLNVLP